MGPHTSTTTHNRSSRKVDPITGALNVVVWISAVIVMGILAYIVHEQRSAYGGYLGYASANSHVVYELTIAVLTVVFYLAAFVLPVHFGLLFNIIFSHLWIVAVAFTASDWSNAGAGALLHAAEAFSFIAFFFLFFNLLHNWYFGSYNGRSGSTSHV